jgi:superoxide reductase
MAMERLSDFVKTADWAKEKHVPVMDCPDSVQAGQAFTVSACVGKEVPHPNTTEHHIDWIALHFVPAGEKNVYEVGRFFLNAHGQAPTGPNEGPIHTDSSAVCNLKLQKSGTLFATSYCNIHGLWESAKQITVQ